MNGSLIHDLIRRETHRLRSLGRGYEAAAKAATAYVEEIHRREIEAKQDRISMGRELRKRVVRVA